MNVLSRIVARITYCWMQPKRWVASRERSEDWHSLCAVLVGTLRSKRIRHNTEI